MSASLSEEHSLDLAHGWGFFQPGEEALFRKGKQAEKEKRYDVAAEVYSKGVRLALDSIQGLPDDSGEKVVGMSCVRPYEELAAKMVRLHQIQAAQKNGGSMKVEILKDDIDFGPETIFADYLDDQVTMVEIDEPIVRSTRQIDLFVDFCVIVIAHAHHLKSICLNTTAVPNEPNHLENLVKESRELNYPVDVVYCKSVIKSEVRLNSGWTFQMERGLDYFQPYAENSLEALASGAPLRKCLPTTIHIVYKAPTEKELV